MNLPLFPLGIVLYPLEEMSLHIFENRYRTMIAECLSEDRAFGIVCAHEEEVATTGCMASIERILKRYPDGRSDIQVVGERRFEILEWSEDHDYPSGRVRFLPDSTDVPEGTNERVIAQHMRLLEIAGRKIRPYLYQRDNFLSFIIAKKSAMSINQQQRFLELSNESERMDYLSKHIEAMIHWFKRDSERKRIRSNGQLRPHD